MKTNVFMSVLVLLAGFSAGAHAFETYESPASSASSSSRSADSGGHPFIPYENRSTVEEVLDDVESNGRQTAFTNLLNRTPGLSFGSYREAARFLRTSDEVSVVRCTDVVGDGEFTLWSYDRNGNRDVTVRRPCEDGEYLIQIGRYHISARCGNETTLVLPKREPEPETPTVRRSSCGAYKSARATGTNTTAQKVNSFHVDFKYSHTNINYIQENGVSCN